MKETTLNVNNIEHTPWRRQQQQQQQQKEQQHEAEALIQVHNSPEGVGVTPVVACSDSDLIWPQIFLKSQRGEPVGPVPSCLFYFALFSLLFFCCCLYFVFFRIIIIIIKELKDQHVAIV